MSDIAEALDNLISDLAADVHASPDGRQADVWPQMVELGLHTVGIDERAGGSGGSLSDAIDLACSLGKHAVSSPFIEHSTAFVYSGDAAPVGNSQSTVSVTAIPVIADNKGSVSGQLSQVPWAATADQLVVFAPGVSGPRVIDLNGPGVRVEARTNAAGEGRDTVYLEGAPSVAGTADASVLGVMNRIGALRSASIAGAVAGAYATTRAYVNEREQFGAPLVKIPAVAANLATIKAELIQATAALERVRHLVDGDLSLPGCSLAVASARVTSARAASVAARLGHQLHGAMGITMEYPLHRHTRRLWAWRDDELSQDEWCVRLTDLATSLGERALWDLTAP